jgi:hypothetical protein
LKKLLTLETWLGDDEVKLWPNLNIDFESKFWENITIMIIRAEIFEKNDCSYLIGNGKRNFNKTWKLVKACFNREKMKENLKSRKF